MKNQVLFLCALLVLVNLYAFSLTVKVGIYEDPPLSFYENEEARGIFPDVLKYIADQEGWNIEFITGDFQTLVSDLQSGKIDVMGPVTHVGMQKGYTLGNQYLLSDWAQLYVPYGSDVDTIFDLKGKRVGILKSSLKTQKFGIKYFLNHLGIKVRFVEFETYSKIFQALHDKRIDAGIVSRFFGSLNKSKYDLRDTYVVFSPVEEKFAFSKNSTVSKYIVPIVDECVEKMRSKPNSFLYKTIQRYLQTPSRGRMPKWLLYVLYVLPFVFLVLLVNIFVLKKAVRMRTKELLRKEEELLKMNEELNASNEEVKAMNEELEDAYEALEKMSVRFQNVSVLISQLDMVEIEKKGFFEEVLDKTLELIPKAEYGTILIAEENEWKFVAVRGHDSQLLDGFSLNLDRVYFPSKVRMVENVLQKVKRYVSPSVFRILKRATKAVKQTLIVPMEISRETVGYITIDIRQGSQESFCDEDIKMAENFAKIASAFYAARRYLKTHEELQNRIILVMVKALEKFHSYTKGHSEHVAVCSMELAKRLGLNEKEQKKIYQAGLLHDIGKLFISKSILDKNGKLTREEYEEVKKHPIIGAELIEEGAHLNEIASIVRSHHERWDGKGYPFGLKGEENPIEARIMAVCDTFDAMTSDRAYRKALGKDFALEEIKKGAGKQFDPKIVEVFLKMMEK